MKYMETEYLIIIQAITAFLLVTSELLGVSKCKSNGIVDFILNHLMCKQEPKIQKIDIETDIEMPVIYQIQTTNPLVARNVAFLAASNVSPLKMESMKDIALPQQQSSTEWSD